MESAAIVVIGNEVLSGKVRDENSPYLVGDLRELGVPVRRIATIPDEIDVIAETVRALSDGFAHVITCGGVGPTLDDVTFEGIARAFGLTIESEPTLERIIRDHFGDRLTDAHLRMARVPVGTELWWEEGLPWPATRVRNVLVLPGSPELVTRKWALIRERYRTAPFTLRRVYLSIDEALIATALEDVDRAWPTVDIGSYPVFAPKDHMTQITFESKDAAAVDEAVEAFVARLPDGALVRMD